MHTVYGFVLQISIRINNEWVAKDYKEHKVWYIVRNLFPTLSYMLKYLRYVYFFFVSQAQEFIKYCTSLVILRLCSLIHTLYRIFCSIALGCFSGSLKWLLESALATPPCGGIQVGNVRSPFGHLSATSHFAVVAVAVAFGWGKTLRFSPTLETCTSTLIVVAILLP